MAASFMSLPAVRQKGMEADGGLSPTADGGSPTRGEVQSQLIHPGEVRSGAILHGATHFFHIEIASSVHQVVVHLHKGSGDPLLMLRHGAPPHVPRRSRIIADFWDQEAFNANAADHHIAVDTNSGLLTPGTWYIGVTNYNYHVRETCRYALTVSLSDARPAGLAGAAAAAAARTHAPPRALRQTPTRARPARPGAAAPSAGAHPPLRTPRTACAPPHAGVPSSAASNATRPSSAGAWPAASARRPRSLPLSETLDGAYAAGEEEEGGGFGGEAGIGAAHGGSGARADGAETYLARTVSVLTAEAQQARALARERTLAERGRRLVHAAHSAQLIGLARAFSGWRTSAAVAAYPPSADESSALVLGLHGRAHTPRARAEDEARRLRDDLADARAHLAFAREHAGKLTATLERERQARVDDASAELELLGALLSARDGGGALLAAAGGGAREDGASSSALLRLFAAVGGSEGALQLGGLKARRWGALHSDARLAQHALAMGQEVGRASAGARGRAAPRPAHARARTHCTAHSSGAPPRCRLPRAPASTRAAISSAAAAEAATVSQLSAQLQGAHAEAEAATARAGALQQELDAARAELHALALEKPKPGPSAAEEVARAEAEALQRTVERELAALEAMTARVERAVSQRSAAPGGRAAAGGAEAAASGGSMSAAARPGAQGRCQGPLAAGGVSSPSRSSQPASMHLSPSPSAPGRQNLMMLNY